LPPVPIAWVGQVFSTRPASFFQAGMVEGGDQPGQEAELQEESIDRQKAADEPTTDEALWDDCYGVRSQRARNATLPQWGSQLRLVVYIP